MKPDFEPKARKLITILGIMNDEINVNRLILELETAYYQGVDSKKDND